MCGLCASFSYKVQRTFSRLALATTFETIHFVELPHRLKRSFMITKLAFIEDDLAEIEKLYKEEKITKEDRIRSILNGLDKFTV